MTISSLAAELEEDHDWRQSEILLLQNQIAKLRDEGEKERLRRASILLVYGHFEGFCRFALTLYVNKINSLGIRCGEASFAVAASSLSKIFAALRNPDKKSDIFRRALPEDKKLHRFARDLEFVERADEIEDQLVSISEDIVDTEANLKPVVLKKNLFKLGISYDILEEFEVELGRLVHLRNNISHGASRSGVSKALYEKYRDSAFAIMNTVKKLILNAVIHQEYLR